MSSLIVTVIPEVKYWKLYESQYRQNSFCITLTDLKSNGLVILNKNDRKYNFIINPWSIIGQYKKTGLLGSDFKFIDGLRLWIYKEDEEIRGPIRVITSHHNVIIYDE